jgi:hypothetical protein
MSSVLGPLYVTDDSTLRVFDSIEDLSTALEAVDVEDGPYKVYDRNGTLLKLTVTGIKRQLWGAMIDQSKASITVEPAEQSGGHRDEFRRLLVDHLGAVGRDKIALSTMSDEDLANEARDAALVRVNRSWLARWRGRNR